MTSFFCFLPSMTDITFIHFCLPLMFTVSDPAVSGILISIQVFSACVSTFTAFVEKSHFIHSSLAVRSDIQDFRVRIIAISCRLMSLSHHLCLCIVFPGSQFDKPETSSKKNQRLHRFFFFFMSCDHPIYSAHCCIHLLRQVDIQTKL